MNTEVQNDYRNEIAFLNRRMPDCKLGNQSLIWKPMPRMEQLISEKTDAGSAQSVIQLFKQKLGAKIDRLQKPLDKIIFAVNAAGSTRVVIAVIKLREVYGSEIDNDDSGGGRGLKNIQPPDPTKISSGPGRR